MIRPDTTVAEYEAEHGGPLYGTQPRPVLPRPQDHAAASGGGRLRRLDLRHPRATRSAHRARRRRGAVGRQVRPGEDQPAAALDARATSGRSSSTNEVPYNPLHDQGYPSASAAGPAREPSGPATTNAPAAGRARRRPNAGCIRSTAANSSAASYRFRRITLDALGGPDNSLSGSRSDKRRTGRLGVPVAPGLTGRLLRLRRLDNELSRPPMRVGSRISDSPHEDVFQPNRMVVMSCSWFGWSCCGAAPGRRDGARPARRRSRRRRSGRGRSGCGRRRCSAPGSGGSRPADR